MGLIGKIVGWRRRLKATCEISVSDSGLIFNWSDGRPQQSFNWPNVSEIRTYKVDCAIYDVICLAFLVDGLWYEVIEHDASFQQVVELLKDQFTGIPYDWHREVMFPAFATNERVLWSAANQPLQLTSDARGS